MNNPEKLATWCTQDGEKQKKRSDGQKKYTIINKINNHLSHQSVDQ
jgi:hypothetical protein